MGIGSLWNPRHQHTNKESVVEYKVLNNGLKMPMVGLGVYNISEGETQRVVEDALSVGYRSIDTAAMYYNEKGVGDAVRACGLSAHLFYGSINNNQTKQ